jgi:sialate O-acetylesterase
MAVVALIAPAADCQDTRPWHDRVCAVVLTYDDALNTHMDAVVPLLDSLGFKGSFYVSGSSPGLTERVGEWTAVAREGHELGNHTLFHPCDGTAPGREWVPAEYDLKGYTVRRMVDEVTAANTLLEAMDGKKERTFAYPCGDRKAGDSSYVAQIEHLFIGARGVTGRMERLAGLDLYDVGSYVINGQKGEELIGLVNRAMAEQALLVFLFHGVGGEHSLNVTLRDHRELLMFLKANERQIWVAPLLEVCTFIKEKRREGS